MRLIGAMAMAGAFVVTPALAQSYGAPCNAQMAPASPGIVGLLLAPMIRQQRAQACAQQREAEAARAQAQAAQAQAQAQQEQAAAYAQQRAYGRQQQAQHAAAIVRAKKEKEAKEAAAAAQTAAEDSPENHCKEPDVGRLMISQFNQFKPMTNLDEQVIDIEHVTTVKFDLAHTDMVCHGTFLTTGGMELTGAFEMRKNIAGDPIVVWKPDRH